MKKHFVIFVIIFFITIGFATINTVLDLNSNIKVAENLEDFKIELTNLKINNIAKLDLIAKDKQSFTFTGSGNDSIEYKITNFSYQYDADINLICIPSENTTVEQIGNLPAQSSETKTITSTNKNVITCTINIEKVGRTDYAEDMCKLLVGTEWPFNYTGSEQKFNLPCDGNYKIEAWGAQGGTYSSYAIGGFGGYSVGNVALSSGEIFINVGGSGSCGNNITNYGGYNGGGTANSTNYYYTCSGGGATHISLASGILSKLSSQKSSVLIVAGSGGGAAYSREGDYGNGGSGGGYIGTNGITNAANSYYTTGGSQNKSGCYFTIDANHTNACNGGYGYGASLIDGQGYYHGGGGGAGWYGGGAVTYDFSPGGGGGSSYIGSSLLTDKSMYCYNCTASNEESTKTISTTCNSATPTPNCAKQGNGYAKITYIGK